VIAVIQATTITSLVVLAATWSLSDAVLDLPIGTITLILAACALLAAAAALLSARTAVISPMTGSASGRRR
jgi:hypothetical protein